jgi:hypothetical protein
MTLNDFYEIHDFVSPRGFQYMFLTPYIMDARPESEVAHGEYKGWEQFLRGQVPESFPLKAYSPLPPDNEQVLLADRARWANQRNAATELESNPFTVPGMTNAPARPTAAPDRPSSPTGTPPAPATP